MIIKTWRDPYDAGFTPTRPKQIELKAGLTVLVGCNGAGKTTLLRNIESRAKENGIPVHMFDNLHDGGMQSISSVFAGFSDIDGDSMEMFSTMFSSSEGERISLNIARQAKLHRHFIETGEVNNAMNRLKKALSSFDDDKDADSVDTNIRLLLFDASDSGVSIDSVCELKDYFRFIVDRAQENGIELYVVVSANEYEMCRDEECFDVNAGKYVAFKDYDDYRRFILRSRERKDKRFKGRKKK